MTALSHGATKDQAGRLCPTAYRYSPAVFDRAPLLAAETLYVIGGLYGNVEALTTVLAMQHAEARQGHTVTLFFNGDFNWFDVDADSFQTINDTVLAHAAIQGNVEAELATPSPEAGCGCAYPAGVADEVVERSNRIMTRLHAQAARFPDLIPRLGALPMHATVAVGDARIGIVHGDPASLAGWGFDVEHLARSEPPGEISDWFRQARVRAFCSTHTCLPVVRTFRIDGRECVVINNGAAGMPNFRDTRYGLLTRVSARPEIPPGSLYGVSSGGLRFDAMPIRYDHPAWLRRFEANWPPDSPAHRSYFGRITAGPDFEPAQAIRGQVTFPHATRGNENQSIHGE